MTNDGRGGVGRNQTGCLSEAPGAGASPAAQNRGEGSPLPRAREELESRGS